MGQLVQANLETSGLVCTQPARGTVLEGRDRLDASVSRRIPLLVFFPSPFRHFGSSAEVSSSPRVLFTRRALEPNSKEPEHAFLMPRPRFRAASTLQTSSGFQHPPSRFLDAACNEPWQRTRQDKRSRVRQTDPSDSSEFPYPWIFCASSERGREREREIHSLQFT